MEKVSNNSVIITQYKWAGSWGPFKIKSHCEECDLTTHVLRALIEKEFKGKDVNFEIKPWLNNVWYCLVRRAWHPPIIMINGKLFFQFSHKKPLFDKEKLIRLVSGILETR
ncbi:MAG: hypothetical protein JSW40_03985 [Candidatus Omnitrophota bacterium]|nr:MAG: hypothetical protein JSW40_03985 [Candidatus Omnitrophota bacterium]